MHKVAIYLSLMAILGCWASNFRWNVIIQPDGTQYHIDRKGNYKKFDRTYTEQSSSRPPLGLFLDVFKQERSFVNK